MCAENKSGGRGGRKEWVYTCVTTQGLVTWTAGDLRIMCRISNFVHQSAAGAPRVVRCSFTDLDLNVRIALGIVFAMQGEVESDECVRNGPLWKQWLHNRQR